MNADQYLFVVDLNERQSDSTNLVWSILQEGDVTSLYCKDKGTEKNLKKTVSSILLKSPSFFLGQPMELYIQLIN